MVEGIDPLMFEAKCPKCGGDFPNYKKLVISTKDYPDLLLAYSCRHCGYRWKIEEVIIQ